MDNDVKRIDLKLLNNQPVFRIGLFNGQEHIDFRIMGKFHVEDGDGNELVPVTESNLKWRVKIKDSKPGKESYFLVLFEAFDRETVEAKLDIARKIDPSAEMVVLGGDIFFGDRKINNNAKYSIVCGDYPSELAARKSFKLFQPQFIPYVEKKSVKEPQGQLEIFDAEYDKSAEATNVVRIVPVKTETKIKIYGVKSFNDILQKENFNDLIFDGTMEFRFDHQSNLMAISEVPLESYMKRVIYSEIGTDLPLEFSKSLAIVCRSEAMARINHRRLGDPFDYGNTGETLRYYGEEYDDVNIDKAVEETAGQVIFADEYIRDTPFHLICGGHTEDSSATQPGNGQIFFTGKYDAKVVPKKFKGLRNEDEAVKWINSRPETWCNLKGRKLPPALEKVKKYFRWEVNYSRRELEEIIRKKTSEDIGILFEIIPITRGASGRLMEIELIGSLKNYRIRGQINIREALAYDYLPSSCFLVERELDETGTPISFTFVGAGHGHGVGMCKTGAAIMALEGHTSDQILEHYFESCQLGSIYEKNLK